MRRPRTAAVRRARPPSAASSTSWNDPAGTSSSLADLEELGLSEDRREPGAEADPPHVHPRHVESVYVLAGEITVSLDRHERRATAGTWVQVPAGVAHAYASTGSDHVRLLELHTPNSGYGDSLRLPGFDQELV